MGLGYCKNCKEDCDCCPHEIQITDKRLLNSQSSVFRNFKNPFFQNELNINDYIIDGKEKKSINMYNFEEERLKTEKEELKKKEEEELKKKKEEELKKREEEELKKKEEEEEEKKKKEELNKLKNEILEKEKQNRKNIINNESQENINNENNIIVDNNNIIHLDNENTILIQKEKEENAKINSTLENMCIIGDITKKEIQEEKKNNPEKFIETSEALNLKGEDDAFFALGLLSQNLEDIGIETAIEKEENEDEQDAAATCLQYITNGLAQKKKYDLHFEFGEERNEELLKDKNEFEEFKKNLKKKLSKDYHVAEDKIIVTFPQKGSFHVQVIFQSDEFNDLDTDVFKQKFMEDDEFEELKNLKEIHSDVILGGCKLSKKLLDEKGNRVEGWGVNEKRGGRPYNPPTGWIGIGLKVLDKYENNNWIGYDGNKDEWCVAYHGVGRFLESDEVKDITGKIIKATFKKGLNQVHKDCENLNRPGTKVGEGVYCTPNVDTACAYSGVSKINGKWAICLYG